MRLARLDLTAFGPFTGTRIDLSAGAPGGLHVVYGPNEAGKSSALRAVIALLYGFEERTPDAHLHGYEGLRVGGVVEAGDVRLELERQKRRKTSLFTPAGEPVDEAVLKKLLGGVDRETFLASFGLGHETLKAGGEQMLKGEASVGETLFDAGTGGLGVRRVLGALEAEAEKLYRPRGKTQEVNLLLERQAEAKRRAQQVLLLPEAFEQQEQELSRITAELAELGRRMEERRVEQHRLRDLKHALPALERRAECLAELETLGDVPDIPAAAMERREIVQARAGEARAAASRLEEDIRRLSRRLSEIEVPDTLLELGEGRIEALSNAVGRTRKARDDRPRIENKLQSLEAEARATLRRMGREGPRLPAEQFRVAHAASARIRALSAEHGKLEARRQGAEQRAVELAREAAEHERRLASTPEGPGTEALELVASLARSLGDVDGALEEVERERSRSAALAARKLRELLPFAGTLAELEALVVPSTDTVERFVTEAAALTAREAALAEERLASERRLLEVQARVSRIQAGGEVPTEAELVRARAERDRAREAVAAAWRAGSAVDELALANERQQTELVDRLADRLRREADRVAELGHALAEREHGSAELEALRKTCTELERARRVHERNFAAAFEPAGFVPLSPPEMRGWLARREQALELHERLAGFEARRERLQADRGRLRLAIAAALGQDEEHVPLGVLVERCAALQTERARAQSERRELERALEKLRARLTHESEELSAATNELAGWRARWVEAVQPLGVGEDVTPGEALELLIEIAALSERLENIEGLEKRIAGIERDEARFAAEVVELARAHGVPFDPRLPDAAAQELVERYRRGESARDQQKELGEQLAQREEELVAERDALAAASQELEALCNAAGARDKAELSLIEARSRRARELRTQLRSIEAMLVDGSGGRPVSALVEEAAGVDGPLLAARLDELDAELEELEERREQARRTQAGILAGRSTQSEGSADAVQDEQAVAAALRERAERYARLRIAAALLDRAIERYRVENQAPVLRRASELFPRLTEGAYGQLRVGREERAIVAVRPDGSEVPPEALSEGTRYQLYLALRLASIERFVASSEPLPLVLDDTLIHFDAARKGATFSVLGELAERMQILFFTHHEEDVTLALERAQGRAFAHELERPKSRVAVARVSA